MSFVEYYPSDSETATTSGSTTPSPPASFFEPRSPSLTPGPFGSRSPTPGPVVTDRGECERCHRDLSLPCAIYKMRPCPGCTGSFLQCSNCHGRGLIGLLRENGTRPDCNACVGTGRMTQCLTCRGSGRVRCEACRGGQVCEGCRGTRRVDCRACRGHGRRRCVLCAASGLVGDFDRFCPGFDVQVGDSPVWVARHHPISYHFERVYWSRVEEEEDVAPNVPPPVPR